ncbi:MAG: T9SS type A sorting domain-containing protein [Flavobacteriales bacterium]|nr:T9SS type A sorting domain-containing protein [Flavobacteriales bacterium]
MTKNLLSLIVVLAMAGTVSAQNCVPDMSITVPGIYPDSITNLPCALVGKLYDATITVVLPADTVGEISPGNTVPVDIDSIKVEDTNNDGVAVSGMPATIGFACEPWTCGFPGNATGCLKLTGIPVIGDVGVHTLIVELMAYVTEPTLGAQFVQPLDSLGYYSIQVVADSSQCTGYWPIPLGLADLDKARIGILKNVPNPFEGRTSIQFILPATGNVHFEVHDLMGSLVYSSQLSGNVGLNKFIFSSEGMNAGVYLYTLDDGTSIATGRMVVSE